MTVTGVIGTLTDKDYMVLVGMLAISCVIRINYAFALRGKITASEFWTGSRSLTAVPVAFSLTASFMSAVTILGAPAEVYHYGAIYSLFGFTYLFVSIITAEVFLPVFYRLRITSTYQYLELRFNWTVRIIGTFIFILLMTLYTGIVIYVAALALNQVTGFNLWGAMVITGLFCTFYCSLGGIRAAVWTDVFHLLITVIGFTAVVSRAVVVQGGINRIIQDSYEGGRLNVWDFNLSPLQRHTFWSITIGGTFTWTGIYGVNQSQVQRYISCKSRFQAKMALYIRLFGLWVILVCSVLSGLCIYSVYRNCDPWTKKALTAPDQLLPYLVLDILSFYPGLPGLFLACVFCGTLSTGSSTLNSLAAVTVEDLIRPWLTSLTENRFSWMTSGTIFFYGVVCIAMSAVAAHMGSAIQTALSVFGMFGGPLLGLFCLGMLFPFANSAGAITGLICGFGISLWIGVGGQVNPPPPERRLPLNLTISGCSEGKFHVQYNWTSTTAMPVLTTLIQPKAIERTAIEDSFYSLSYLHLSTLGTLVVILVGVIVSILSGGRKQKIDRKYLHSWKDLSYDLFACCRCDTTKSKNKDVDLSPELDAEQQIEVNNPAFQDAEMDLIKTEPKKYNFNKSIVDHNNDIPSFPKRKKS